MDSFRSCRTDGDSWLSSSTTSVYQLLSFLVRSLTHVTEESVMFRSLSQSFLPLN